MRTWTFLLAAAMLLSGCASEGEEPVADAGLDSDGDGFPDALEQALGSDPQSPDSVPDVMVHKDISFVDSGMIMMGTENPVASECGTQGAPVDAFALIWPIAAPANATDAHVVDLKVTATLPPTMAELDIYVYGPGGDLLTAPTTMTIPPSSTDTVAVEGKQPVGDFRIEVRGCLGSGEVPVQATAVLGYTPDIEELLHAQGVAHHH